MSVSAADLAEHIAGIMDGDYDDGLEAFVAATARGSVIDLGLYDDGSARVGGYKITVEKVD